MEPSVCNPQTDITVSLLFCICNTILTTNIRQSFYFMMITNQEKADAYIYFPFFYFYLLLSFRVPSTSCGLSCMIIKYQLELEIREEQLKLGMKVVEGEAGEPLLEKPKAGEPSKAVEEKPQAIDVGDQTEQQPAEIKAEAEVEPGAANV